MLNYLRTRKRPIRVELPFTRRQRRAYRESDWIWSRDYWISSFRQTYEKGFREIAHPLVASAGLEARLRNVLKPARRTSTFWGIWTISNWIILVRFRGNGVRWRMRSRKWSSSIGRPLWSGHVGCEWTSFIQVNRRRIFHSIPKIGQKINTIPAVLEWWCAGFCLHLRMDSIFALISVYLLQ